MGKGLRHENREKEIARTREYTTTKDQLHNNRYSIYTIRSFGTSALYLHDRSAIKVYKKRTAAVAAATAEDVFERCLWYFSSARSCFIRADRPIC